MRLLTVDEHGELEITRNLIDDIPPYAILSHTWSQNSDDEVSLVEIQTREGQNKSGYQKIKFCIEQAKRDGIDHCWVDSCCIDQKNLAELTEAITSMFRWYKNAEKCYVYLSDVTAMQDHQNGTDRGWMPSFCASRWFTRGWTLQELIAPTIVEFFSKDAALLGTKLTLLEQISSITSIPLSALCGTPPTQFSIGERWKWAQHRETRRKEDKAYCLFGIFDVFLPLIYGEGDNAFRRLEEEVERRSAADRAQPPLKARMRRVNEDISVQSSDKRLRSEDHTSHSIRDQTHTQQSFATKSDEILVKSLAFERIDFRVKNVKKSLLHTCEWLFRHPHFRTWYKSAAVINHNGFLWIKGKPGCGKSTLMKAALEWVQKATHSASGKRSIIPYFYNARAAASLEKSSLGLYYTIAHHLISKHDSLLRLFLSTFALKEVDLHVDLEVSKRTVTWTIEELQNFLFESIESGHSFELYLFIDALDEAEYEEDVRRMISFLIQLADRSFAAGSTCQLRICLSSRHYPHISVGRGLSLVVEDQPEHADDIAKYIAKQLLCANEDEKLDLQGRISAKSNSIFLWVVLVVEILNRLDDQGAPLSDMQACLETVPTDLNELFRHILLRGELSIETSVLLFQWILFGMEALDPVQLFVAMIYSRSPTNIQWTVPALIILPSSDRLARHILNYSRGLVEIVQTGEIQFIHETVREFLLGKYGLASTVPALASNLEGVSHEILRIACQRCIAANTVPDGYRTDHITEGRPDPFLAELRTALILDHSFLTYAMRYYIDHDKEAQKHNGCQQTFLNIKAGDLRNDSYRIWWNVMELNRTQDNLSKLQMFVEITRKQRVGIQMLMTNSYILEPTNHVAAN